MSGDTRQALAIRAGDVVANLLHAARKGDVFSVRDHGTIASVTASQDIPRFHKIALCAIAADQKIVRGGLVIGRATGAIKPGDWVHSHNLESLRAKAKSPILKDAK